MKSTVRLYDIIASFIILFSMFSIMLMIVHQNLWLGVVGALLLMLGFFVVVFGYTKR